MMLHAMSQNQISSLVPMGATLNPFHADFSEKVTERVRPSLLQTITSDSMYTPPPGVLWCCSTGGALCTSSVPHRESLYISAAVLTLCLALVFLPNGRNRLSVCPIHPMDLDSSSCFRAKPAGSPRLQQCAVQSNGAAKQHVHYAL